MKSRDDHDRFIDRLRVLIARDRESRKPAALRVVERRMLARRAAL